MQAKRVRLIDRMMMTQSIYIHVKQGQKARNEKENTHTTSCIKTKRTFKCFNLLRAIRTVLYCIIITHLKGNSPGRKKLTQNTHTTMTQSSSRQTNVYCLMISILCFIFFSHLLETVQAFIAVAPASSSISPSVGVTTTSRCVGVSLDRVETATTASSDVVTATVTTNDYHDDVTATSNHLGQQELLRDDQDTEEFLDKVLTDGLYQVNMIMDEYFMNNYPDESLQDLFRKCINSVEMKQSNIPNAGNGLFATVDIPAAGQIVSFYPVHTLGVTFDDDGGENYSVTLRKKKKKQNNEEETTTTCSVAGSAYTLYLLGQRQLAGVDLDKLSNIVEGGGGVRPFADVDITRPIVEGWMGHLINDGAIVTKINDIEYYKNSQNVQNCVIAPFGPSPVLVVVTTKPIKKGEELFTSYGYSYWSEMLDNTAAGVDDNENSVRYTSSKSEEILKQEMEAMDDLFTTFDTLQESYEEEATALHGAFDAMLAHMNNSRRKKAVN